jgi:hypothetical protein
MEHPTNRPEESRQPNDLEHMSVDDIFYYKLLIDGGPDDTLEERQRLDRFIINLFELPSVDLEHGTAVLRAFAAHEDLKFRTTAANLVDGLYLADPAAGLELWAQLLRDPKVGINAYHTVGEAAEQGLISKEDEALLSDIYKEAKLTRELRSAGLLVEDDEDGAASDDNPAP